MAIYRTNTAELTSIADAIRAKTGESSPLVYPTGFVSAIQGISTGSTNTSDGFGSNPELVSTLLDDTVLLKDTDYNTWTPSTTASVILPLSNLTAVTLNTSEYDYIAHVELSILFNYTSGTTVVNGPLELYYYGTVFISRRSASRTQYNQDTREQSTYDTQERHVYLYAYNDGSTYITFSNYGIYVSMATPGMSNTNTTTPTVTFRTPVVRAICSDTYMTTAMANAIDKNTTGIKRKITLYRYTKDSTYGNIAYQKLNNLYTAAHSNT